MFGDVFRKVQPGEKLVIPAAVYNAFLDAVKAYQQFDLSTQISGVVRQADLIKVKNETGLDLPIFAIVGLDEIWDEITPNRHSDSVKFRAVVPQRQQHAGKFAVLIEPLPRDGVGLAAVAGVVPVKIRWVDGGSDQNVLLAAYAEVDDQLGVTALALDPGGTARVLWVDRESYSPDQQVVWGIVRLADYDLDAFVIVEQNGSFIARYNFLTNSWDKLYPCNVIEVNDGSLVPGVYVARYLGRRSEDLYPTYGVVCCGAGTATTTTTTTEEPTTTTEEPTSTTTEEPTTTTEEPTSTTTEEPSTTTTEEPTSTTTEEPTTTTEEPTSTTTEEPTTTTTSGPALCPQRYSGGLQDWFTTAYGGAFWSDGYPDGEIRINFARSVDCGGWASVNQIGYACTRLILTQPTTVRFALVGQTEEARAGYETIDVQLNQTVIMSGASTGGGGLCGAHRHSQVLDMTLDAGQYLIELYATTVDNMDHFDSFWAFSISFLS